MNRECKDTNEGLLESTLTFLLIATILILHNSWLTAEDAVFLQNPAVSR